MPCQVPVASLPFEMGTLTLAPMRADLICAYRPSPVSLRPDSVHTSKSQFPPSHLIFYTNLPPRLGTLMLLVYNAKEGHSQAYHPSPRHHVCIIPVPSCPLVQFYPVHRSCPI